MAEWSNAAVSKTVVRHSADRGFESPSLRKQKPRLTTSGGVFVSPDTGSLLPGVRGYKKASATPVAVGVFACKASPKGITRGEAERNPR